MGGFKISLVATHQKAKLTGGAMTRRYIDCRNFPSEMNCSVAISADSEKELMEAAVQHAMAVHGHKDSPELRDQVKKSIREGSPPN